LNACAAPALYCASTSEAQLQEIKEPAAPMLLRWQRLVTVLVQQSGEKSEHFDNGLDVVWAGRQFVWNFCYNVVRCQNLLALAHDVAPA
jgi:hypothetical protein